MGGLWVELLLEENRQVGARDVPEQDSTPEVPAACSAMGLGGLRWWDSVPPPPGRRSKALDGDQHGDNHHPKPRVQNRPVGGDTLPSRTTIGRLAEALRVDAVGRESGPTGYQQHRALWIRHRPPANGAPGAEPAGLRALTSLSF